ncbi:hypothetical protein M9Y10_040559 [Tritrichomonas musculus]|uniref:Protein kinase domain-containing protein n=1 Tax=Tritrichomonas musculus TaxID=1915356 RepID=A0ABR2GP71_9EUKA
MNSVEETFNFENIEIIKRISLKELQKIYKARSKINNNTKYFIISTADALEHYSFEMIIDLYHMVNIMTKLNYPSILKFIGFSKTNFKNKQKPTIVTEYSKYIIDVDFSNNPLIVIYGIASAISYLHSHGILHRNLGIEHIYLDKLFHPKLTGFDYSVDISANLASNQPIKFSVLKFNY